MKLTKKYITIGTAIILIIILSSLINIVNPKDILNSPDEVSNYIVMKEYASSGHMYLEGKYIENDANNLLHQRGFLTWNKKIVPFNFLGFPFFFGPIYNFIGKQIKIVLTLIYSILLLIIIYKLYFLIFNKKDSFFTTISLIFITPLLFYLNLFYFNIIPNIIFSLLFLIYLLKFNKEQAIVNLYLAVFFAGVAIFFRYEIILFIFIVFMTNLILNLEIYKKINNKIRNLLIMSLIFCLVFIIPLLVLNYMTYGSPLTYGYSAFNKVYFPNDRTGSLLNSVRGVLFPSQVFSLITFFNNIKSTILILSPILLTFVLFGILMIFSKKMIYYLFIVLYLLIFNGMNPTTFLSGSSIPTLTFAVLRYWLILFPLTILPLAYYLNKNNLNKKVKIILISLLLITAILFITVTDPRSSVVVYKDYFKKVENNKLIIGNITNPSDYIITSTNGKLYYDQVNIISWWGGPTRSESDKFFNSTNIANITLLLLSQNYSIYYLEDNINTAYIPIMKKEGLSFEPVASFSGLYKISTQNKTI